MKRLRYLLLFLLTGLLMPAGIWVAGGSALYQKAKEKKASTDSFCFIDADCPRGFICISGCCVPKRALFLY